MEREREREPRQWRRAQKIWDVHNAHMHAQPDRLSVQYIYAITEPTNTSLENFFLFLLFSCIFRCIKTFSAHNYIQFMFCIRQKYNFSTTKTCRFGDCCASPLAAPSLSLSTKRKPSTPTCECLFIFLLVWRCFSIQRCLHFALFA